MNLSRLVLGIFAVGLAGTFCVNALGYPDKAANMPLIYSVVVALLGVAMIGQEVLSAKAKHRHKVSADGPAPYPGDEAVSGEPPTDGQAGERKPWKAMLVFLLAALYLYSISVLGYLIATVAFMAVALTMIGHVSWRFAAIGIVLLVAMVCTVFIGFLGLPVPLLPPLLFP